MKRLPLTVIGGYLGAGKTTLINRLLTEDHGKRLMVMVNDFGAVNIDASLIKAKGVDTIELTNGCVCCTMGADLFMAVGDVLDRPKWPDHLIIEASGIGDPARIANVSRNEPELSYAGIVTVVDGENFEDLLGDVQIAPQLASQVAVADLVVVSKVAQIRTSLRHRLEATGAARMMTAEAEFSQLLWDIQGEVPDRSHAHAHFAQWSEEVPGFFSRDQITALLKSRPSGLYRVKGFVRLLEGMAEVQVVGKSVEITLCKYEGTAVLVGIGPQAQFDMQAIKTWWEGA
ncbi:MAG: GTP-binding protein [Aliishimia sp.]